eukprot:6178831-Pleurochrysis_carterae.AAC.1
MNVKRGSAGRCKKAPEALKHGCRLFCTNNLKLPALLEVKKGSHQQCTRTTSKLSGCRPWRTYPNDCSTLTLNLRRICAERTQSGAAHEGGG